MLIASCVCFCKLPHSQLVWIKLEVVKTTKAFFLLNESTKALYCLLYNLAAQLMCFYTKFCIQTLYWLVSTCSRHIASMLNHFKILVTLTILSKDFGMNLIGKYLLKLKYLISLLMSDSLDRLRSMENAAFNGNL